MDTAEICSKTGCAFQCWHSHVGVQITCIEGEPTCSSPKFIKGHRTPFHDHTLEEATQKLNEVIDAIPADPEGRSLAFVMTKKGLRLVWLRHGPPPHGARLVTDEGEIDRDFLGFDD